MILSQNIKFMYLGHSIRMQNKTYTPVSNMLIMQMPMHVATITCPYRSVHMPLYALAYMPLRLQSYMPMLISMHASRALMSMCVMH
jgi:hypothetical protein